MKCSSCGYESTQLVTCPKCNTNHFDLFQKSDQSCDLVHGPIRGIFSGLFIGVVSHSVLMILVTQIVLLYNYLTSEMTYSFIGMPYEARRELLYNTDFAVVYLLGSLLTFLFVRFLVNNTELIPCSKKTTYLTYFFTLTVFLSFIVL